MPMYSKIEDEVAENLIKFYSIMHKRLISNIAPASNPVSPRFKILLTLLWFGPMPSSRLGRILNISKPHMTKLTDRLVRENLIRKNPSTNDRRVVELSITPKGRKFILSAKTKAKNLIIKNIDKLTKKDLRELNKSLKNINLIISKLG